MHIEKQVSNLDLVCLEEIRLSITPELLVKAVEEFRSQAGKGARQKNHRLIRIKSGLFIKEGHVDHLATVCLRILKTGADPEEVVAAKKRIVDLCGRKLWRFRGESIDVVGYALMNKDVELLLQKYEIVPGFVYDLKLLSPVKSAISQPRGNPSIRVVDKIKEPEATHIAELTVGTTIYLLSRHAFEEFVADARRSRTIKARYKNPGTQSSYLLAFHDKFKRATPVKRENNVLQIIRHGFEDAKYLWVNGWVFVIKDRVIKTCYEKGEMAGLYKKDQRK
ncbi:MAG: hypothetical protein AAB594_02755 [Patescibacteria group bacterium]